MPRSTVDPAELGKYLADSTWRESLEIPANLNLKNPAHFQLEFFCLSVFLVEYSVRLVWGDESDVTEQVLSNLYASAMSQIQNGAEVMRERCTIYGQALNALPERTSIGVHLGTTLMKAIDEDDIVNRTWVGLFLSRSMIARTENLRTVEIREVRNDLATSAQSVGSNVRTGTQIAGTLIALGGVAALFIMTVVWSNQRSVVNPSPNPPVASTADAKVVDAGASSVSQHDLDMLGHLSELISNWNRISAPLVRDYLDPGVTRQKWSAASSEQIGRLWAIQLELRATAPRIVNPDIRSTIVEIEQNYRLKVDALRLLNNAVVSGDEAAEKRALDQLASAGADARYLGPSLIERLTPFVDPRVLEREFRKRGIDLGTGMQP